jgi:hypothetical protein
MFPFSSVISSCACYGWHWPVILGDTRPEYPDHDYSQQGEQRLEETAVDLAVCASADVHADNVLENLSDREEERGANEVYCIIKLVVGIVMVIEYLRIGLRSPRMRRTKKASNRKNITRKTNGTSWYSVYSAYAWLGVPRVSSQ